MEQESQPQLVSKAVVVNIQLNEQEKKILDGITKNDYFSSINPYLIEILIDGGTDEKNFQHIMDFINDWRADNVETQQPLPAPMRFIEIAILAKADADYAKDPTQIPNFNSPNPQYQEQPITLDLENLPSYLPKIYDMIEREVQRRVKVEMKEFNQLLKKHEELKLKFQHISKMFNVD